MNTRNWSIRSKITALLLVPLLALVVLWGFATSLTVPPAIDLLNFRTTSENVGLPAEILMTELQRERRLSVIYLGGSPKTLAVLDEQRARTDQAAAVFRRSAGSTQTQDAASELGRRRVSEMFNALNLLPSGRAFIDRREMDRAGALGLYNGIIDVAFRMFQPLTDVSDPDLARESRTLVALARARELLAQEDAMISGALVAGRFGDNEGGQVTQLIGTQRFLYADAVAELPEQERTRYRRLTEDIQFGRLRAMEDLISTRPGGSTTVPVNAEQWQAAYGSVMEQLRDFEVAQATAVRERAQPVAVQIVVRLAAAGVLGLIAVATAVWISLRIGRSLVVRLTGLRRAALDMAGHRLPGVVARLRRGEQIDVAAEAPPLEYGADEIGQLGRAFTEVQLTAVRSAVDEADVRKGLSEVFLNIARRSQTLLHRQLALLDKMERRTSEPDELEALFRIDHLATRMRRHAEDLVILAGAAPGRGWRNPVPMIDVIRGAVSEVEDYARVNVLTVEDAALVGRAVSDLTHLLAELIENATSFSPPQTRVHVSGQALPNGYAVEIEDRGLGMAPEAIAEANDRLATPPEFDPANSARLGLFVVGRLATRQGVRVQLRSSPYGGVTAVVLIQQELIVTGEPTSARQPTSAPQPAEDTGADQTAPVQTAPVHAAPALPAEPVLPAEPAAPAEPGPGRARRMRAVPRPGTGMRPVLVPAPRAPEPDPEPGPSVGGPIASRQPLMLSEDGLPRRVRQASLAPQLREPSGPQPDPEPEAPLGRSPEQIRARMSALQSGTRRGRLDGRTPGTPAGEGSTDGPPPRVRASVPPPAGSIPPPAGSVPPLAGSVPPPAGSVGGSLDLPTTGPLGPAGSAAGRDEDWFRPSRPPEPPAAQRLHRNDPEEDA